MTNSRVSLRQQIVAHIYHELNTEHSNMTLSAILGYPESSVRRATREAVERGDLIRERRYGYAIFKAVPLTS